MKTFIFIVHNSRVALEQSCCRVSPAWRHQPAASSLSQCGLAFSSLHCWSLLLTLLLALDRDIEPPSLSPCVLAFYSLQCWWPLLLASGGMSEVALGGGSGSPSLSLRGLAVYKIQRWTLLVALCGMSEAPSLSLSLRGLSFHSLHPLSLLQTLGGRGEPPPLCFVRPGGNYSFQA